MLEQALGSERPAKELEQHRVNEMSAAHTVAEQANREAKAKLEAAREEAEGRGVSLASRLEAESERAEAEAAELRGAHEVELSGLYGELSKTSSRSKQHAAWRMIQLRQAEVRARAEELFIDGVLRWRCRGSRG